MARELQRAEARCPEPAGARAEAPESKEAEDTEHKSEGKQRKGRLGLQWGSHH